jgi:hypothetical protein
MRPFGDDHGGPADPHFARTRTGARWPSLLRPALLVVLLALAGLYAAHVLRVYGEHTVDDAAIAYAYADNLGHGRGFRLTPGQAPVEGFSSPLQVLLLAPFAPWVEHLDPVSKRLNVAFATAGLLGLALLLWRRLRGPAILLAPAPLLFPYLWPGFNYWIAAGLEGGLLTGLQILSLLFLAGGLDSRPREIGLGVAAGLLAWCRPEGAAYGAIAVLLPLATRPRRWLPPALFLALTTALFLLRFALFRDFLPNTYWAKVHFLMTAKAGWSYVTWFLAERGWYFATALPLLGFLCPALRPAAVAALAQLAFAFYFPVHVGGDWMREWRFLQPAMGPLAALTAFGAAGLDPRQAPVLRGRMPFWAMALGLALLPPLAVAFSGPSPLERARSISGSRDLDMKLLASVGRSYEKLGRRLALERPPLVAEVDVGGLSYRRAVEVVDLGGLADRVLARAWTRRSAVAIDYLFGERRPDFIHVHSSWLSATPVQAYSPFARDYRVIDPAQLRELGLGPLTGIRADLVAPWSAPVLRLDLPIPGGRLVGLTAIRLPSNEILLASHALTSGFDLPAPVRWTARDGREHRADWNLGLSLAPGPPASAVLGLARLPADALPLDLQGTALRLQTWPLVGADGGTVEDLTRGRLLRLAEIGGPGCDPDRLLDPDADGPARARGMAFIARLCEGLAEPHRTRLAALARRIAKTASNADDTYDAAVAALALESPHTLKTKLLIDRSRARPTPYDEIVRELAHQRLASTDDASAEDQALRLLLEARRYEEVLLLCLFGALGDRETAQAAACAAGQRLGLRTDRLGGGYVCNTAVPTLRPVKVIRQSFEHPESAGLTYLGGASNWPVSAAQVGQHRASGGHGRRFLSSSSGAGSPLAGEVLWGPLPPAGAGPSYVGALLAGVASPDVFVAVETKQEGRWVEIGRLPTPPRTHDMTPVWLPLPKTPGAIRVRIAHRSSQPEAYILVDAITFISL